VWRTHETRFPAKKKKGPSVRHASDSERAHLPTATQTAERAQGAEPPGAGHFTLCCHTRTRTLPHLHNMFGGGTFGAAAPTFGATAAAPTGFGAVPGNGLHALTPLVSHRAKRSPMSASSRSVWTAGGGGDTCIRWIRRGGSAGGAAHRSLWLWRRARIRCQYVHTGSSCGALPRPTLILSLGAAATGVGGQPAAGLGGFGGFGAPKPVTTTFGMPATAAPPSFGGTGHQRPWVPTARAL
jgi:hypothetical protein